MFCNHCGSPVTAGHTACPQCGISMIWPQAAIAARVRVASQLHLLAILWFVSGALFLIPAAIMAVLAGVVTIPVATRGDKIAIVLVPSVFLVLCVFFLISAVLRLVAGWGLLKIRPWGRTYAVVMAFLELISPPLGTALGIYTLYVLLPDEAGDEFRLMSQGTAAAPGTVSKMAVV